ncbi:MAG TPA: hypothetical protein VL173_00385 [Vicinamibacterales bacterium]|nr:hypothetical protein [Vicinamibacterales bacterium]
MTARLARTVSSLLAVLLLTACTNYYEIPIETPIRPKLDVSAFQRVLVAGFISGGTDDVDSNLETTRLLRSQLRNKSDLRVIDADVLPLMEVATQGENPPSDQGTSGTDSAAASAPAAPPAPIKEEKDLAPYERLFANADYWKKIGEEYQQPLIVTGTIMLIPETKNSVVQSEQEQFDSFGRRRTTPVRTYVERKGFALRPKFVFIDGRTGMVLHSERFAEEVLYNANQTTPALSSYFELMDKVIPSFLSTLSSQKIKGTRILLQ